MYQYENGVKKKNVGYARVEARDGQCKITLHLQLPGLLDSIFPTYLIQRKNNTELIYLGDSILKNQIMDSKLTASDTNIMGTGYGLSDIGGILLFLNNNVFYATEWDDRPIVMKEVLEAMNPKSKKTPGQEVTKQKELAEKVGTKQSAISRLENGSYNPSIEFLSKIAHALGKEIQVKFF
jgi:DNA-binding XRE family transcriptional regulator